MLDKKLMEKVIGITYTDYSDITDLKELSESIIEDLLGEISHLEEEFEDFKRNVEDNYEQISYESMI